MKECINQLLNNTKIIILFLTQAQNYPMTFVNVQFATNNYYWIVDYKDTVQQIFGLILRFYPKYEEKEIKLFFGPTELKQSEILEELAFNSETELKLRFKLENGMGEDDKMTYIFDDGQIDIEQHRKEVAVKMEQYFKAKEKKAKEEEVARQKAELEAQQTKLNKGKDKKVMKK